MTSSFLTRSRAASLLLCAGLASFAAAQPAAEVHITSPLHGETLHDNDGRVRVVVSLAGAPAGRPVSLRPLVDGKPRPPDRQATTFVLDDIDRGQHVLQVQWIDGAGAVIASSPPVTFHLWRASAGFPNRKD